MERITMTKCQKRKRRGEKKIELNLNRTTAVIGMDLGYLHYNLTNYKFIILELFFISST